MGDLSGQERLLVEWLADMNEDQALALADRMLRHDGADPLRVLELCRMAMDIVGRRFEQGEYFLPELVLAGEMLDTIGKVAKPMTRQGEGSAGMRRDFKVMIGGGQIDETVRNYTGADAFGVNVVEAVALCRQWMTVRA